MSESTKISADQLPPGFVTDSDVLIVNAAENEINNEPITPRRLLHIMAARQKYLGAPLPEGFVPPPGIDIEELLKQLPPPSPPTT